MLKFSRLTVEHVRVPVAEIVDGDVADVTAFTVKQASMLGSSEPTSGDYSSTSWESDVTTVPARYWALFEIDGPGLGRGTFAGWLKIDSGSDVVQRKVFEFRIE